MIENKFQLLMIFKSSPQTCNAGITINEYVLLNIIFNCDFDVIKKITFVRHCLTYNLIYIPKLRLIHYYS